MTTFQLCSRLHSPCPSYMSLPFPSPSLHCSFALHPEIASLTSLFPLSLLLPGGSRTESIAEEDEMAAETFPAGLRVLAVDDNRICLKVLERQLKYCNYNVTTVTNAQTALDMLRERKDENQFDLVITDVYMPNMDGFKLLELIGLEMDLPVIMLSEDGETKTIVKGIKHGACDYLVKPARLEQIRGIWKHVVKNSKTDHAVRKLPSGDGDKVEKAGANHSRKNKKVVNVVDEDKENTSTQKKQRVKWGGELHWKFVQAIDQIGMDRAVPKKILQVMNVEGLTKDNVASHLQKYRIYLRKLNEGTLRNPNPFADETEALWRNMNFTSFIGSPSSSNQASMNSLSAIGTQASLPTESVQIMSSQKNLGIPQPNMEPVGHNVNLPKNVVPMPVQDISRFISSGKSFAPVLIGGLPGASQCLPSGPSGSSFANSSNGVVLNTSKPFSVEYQKIFAGITGNTVPMVGFGEQVAAFSFGNNTHSTAPLIGNSALASSSSTRPDLQIDNSAMPTQVLNGGGASGNLHVGSTGNQQAVRDQLNNINEFLMGPSEAQNGESDNLDDVFAYFDQDFINNGDFFIDGDRDFAP